MIQSANDSKNIMAFQDTMVLMYNEIIKRKLTKEQIREVNIEYMHFLKGLCSDVHSVSNITHLSIDWVHSLLENEIEKHSKNCVL